MKKIHHIRLIGLIGLIGLISSSCNNGEAVYITEPTEIDLFVDPSQLTASTASILAT